MEDTEKILGNSTNFPLNLSVPKILPIYTKTQISAYYYYFFFWCSWAVGPNLQQFTSTKHI